MSFRHRVDFKCDTCDREHMLDEGMELPPNWMGVQIAFSNAEGIIPEHEQEVFNHFCSLQCLAEFVQSEEVKERFYLSDEDDDDEDDEGGDEKPSPDSGPEAEQPDDE